MKFNALDNESNTKYCCENKSMIETVITSRYHCVGIHPQICLWLRNSTRNNTGKSSIYNHGDYETQTQHNHKGNITVLAIETCMTKTVRFLSRNQWVLWLNLIVTI